ncbi:MAG: HEAT repeat domain-containing protein [bacterium]|nr:HEAT repeat domain-containing protein [bacterium]
MTSMLEQAIQNLTHADSRVRYAAAQSLGQSEDRRALAPLIDALPDENAKVQYAALSSLIKLGFTEATAPIIDLLIDKLDSQVWGLIKLNVGMRLRAGLLDMVQKGDTALSDRLLHVMETNDTLDDLQRAFFIRLIGKTGDTRRVDLLVRLLIRDPAPVQVASAEALGWIGDSAAVPTLLLFARSHEDTLSDAAVREVAIEALGRIGDPVVLDTLLNALQDENEWIRRAAAEALGRIGDPAAMEWLVNALKDESAMVQDTAFDAIKLLDGVEKRQM